MSTASAVRPAGRRRTASGLRLEDPWSLFPEAYQAIRQRTGALLNRFDLQVSEYVLLRLCARGPAKPSEVARAMGITPAGATDVIDRLERRKLVERLLHPADRRAVLVRITPAGGRLYHEAKSVEAEVLHDLETAMSDDQRRALSVGLAAVIRALPRDPD